MLKKLTDGQTKTLMLADHLDGLHQSRFEMGDWGYCIAGQTLRLFDDIHSAEVLRTMGAFDIRARAMELLGLELPEAVALFQEADLLVTPGRAASVLRHFVATGEVVWS